MIIVTIYLKTYKHAFIHCIISSNPGHEDIYRTRTHCDLFTNCEKNENYFNQYNSIPFTLSIMIAINNIIICSI